MWTPDLPDQTGRTALVTGANSGIGFETAAALAGRGARVVLACRSADKAEDAAARIRARHPGATLEVRALDLADLDSVRRFAGDVRAAHPRLDLLILNAGVMVPPQGTTKQGFETQLGTNHLGHFALTALLLPAVTAAGGRVVVVSSGVHHAGRIDFDDPNWQRRPYSAWGAYCQSKLANLSFALELSRRLAAAGSPVRVTAAHPGWTHTELQRTAPFARFFGPWLAMTPPQGALPTLRAATDPDAGAGSYWGPRWLELVGPPVRARINRKARDPEVAKRLWALSEELTGVRFDLPEAKADAA
jgi:NAD(P)-dependent dehydrogenase (short-subunit alcohol dehydrogenase family)